MADGEAPLSGGEPERFDLGTLADLPPKLGLSRLPVGRHGLPRSFVSSNQRLRIIAALLELLPRHGYSELTIGQVTQKAGVSRTAFYAQFDGKEECFLATYDLVNGWLAERIERAIALHREWPARVCAGVSVALQLLAANPPLAHLVGVEALQAGPAARGRRQACLVRLAEMLRTGYPARPDGSADLEEMLLGGVLSLIGRYVDAGRTQQLSQLADEIARYLLLPYLGPGETKRIGGLAA